MMIFHLLFGLGIGLTIYGLGFYRGLEQGRELRSNADRGE